MFAGDNGKTVVYPLGRQLVFRDITSTKNKCVLSPISSPSCICHCEISVYYRRVVFFVFFIFTLIDMFFLPA